MQSTTETLIVNHREYVRKLAREIHNKLPSHVIYDDLVGFGEVGLVEAAGKYDPASGAAFTTFAYFRIRGAIFDGLGKMTGITPALRRRIKQEEGMDEAAEWTPTPADDPESLSRSMHDTVGRLGAVFLVAHGGEEDSPLEGRDDSEPGEKLETREVVQKVQQAVASMDPELAEVIQLFYFEGCSMTDIGTRLALNKSSVSRRHSKAIDALRDALQESVAA